MSIFGAYLEDFGLIKIMLPQEVKELNPYLIEKNTNNIIPLFINNSYIDQYGFNLFVNYNEFIDLHLDYFVHVTENSSFHLNIGKITRLSKFDEFYYNDSKLGALYSKDQTLFRVWSPVAKEVILMINHQEIPLNYRDKGLWELTLKGDLLGCLYNYKVRVNEKYLITTDLYGFNASFNNESSIVTDLKILKKSKFKTIPNPIIEEISIRDITSFEGGGTFGDLTKHYEYLDYFKGLGINTLQIMPINTFGGVDERNFSCYNWGYNPLSYFSISRLLTMNQDDCFAPMVELNNLINLIHEKKMNVVLDVVYNHVYIAESFPLNVFVPGYAYHYKADGFLNDDSGCGNVLNSKRLMVRKLIIDSLVYFAENYNVDGFRFDLLGLLDVETMKEATLRLKEINPTILLYGEGWNMSSSLLYKETAIYENKENLPEFSFFNSYFRTILKPDLPNNFGFCLGSKVNNDVIFSIMTKQTQSINYVECHDNFTFCDTIKNLHPEFSFKQVKDFIKLSIMCIAFAKGIPFYHLGEEFGRSKKMDGNSYKSSDFINRVNFNDRIKYYDVINTLKDALNLRENLQIFNNDVDAKIYQDDFNKCLVSPAILYTKENKEYLLIIKNNNDEESFSQSFPFEVIFNKDHLEKIVVSNFKLSEIGCYLINLK